MHQLHFFLPLSFPAPCHLVCGWARSGAELVLTRADKGVAATPTTTHALSDAQQQSRGLEANLVPKWPEGELEGSSALSSVMAWGVRW